MIIINDAIVLPIPPVTNAKTLHKTTYISPPEPPAEEITLLSAANTEFIVRKRANRATINNAFKKPLIFFYKLNNCYYTIIVI